MGLRPDHIRRRFRRADPRGRLRLRRANAARRGAGGGPRSSGVNDLTHNRWALPALAELHRAGGGAKLITLANRLDVARGTLRRTLAALADDGWVMPNPGYGHPMRPEHILTDSGRAIAPHCQRVYRLLRRLDAEEPGLRKWVLGITTAVAGGAIRFSAIRNANPPITARALTLALKQLQQAALIERTVYDEYPPAVEYRLTPRARRLAAAATDLARKVDEVLAA